MPIESPTIVSPAAELAALFPAEVVTAAANPQLVAGSLPPSEAAHIEQAVGRRRRQFTAGRLCARHALGALGVTEFPLLVGEDRAPLWPADVVGSIAHTTTYCGVVVAPRGEIVALGVDVEPAEGFKRSLWSHVLTPGERDWVESQARSDQATVAKLIFSAKECTYKCQYTITRSWLGFQDVAVEVDPERGTYDARLVRDVSPARLAVDQLPGRFHCAAGLILTGMTLRSSALATPTS